MIKNFSKLILCNKYNLRNFHFQKSLITFNNLIQYHLFSSKSSDHLIHKITEKDLTPINIDDETLDIRKVSDINHKLRLSRHHRRHDVNFYLRLIKKAALEGNKEKMLTVFFHDMLIVDRVKPTLLLVNILLKKLAELGGHSEVAFKILKKLKEIQMIPSSVTYSLVFKNCSKEIGNNEIFWNLSRNTIKLVSDEEMQKIQSPAVSAFKIWKAFDEKDHCLKIGAINSLLLTLGRAGMLKESFIVLDTFLQEGNRPDSYTLVAMLEGCLFDRKNGFGLALAIYNKLVYNYKCSLSPYVFTTLLKVIEICQFGNHFLVEKITQSSVFNTNQTFLSFHDDISISSNNISNSVDRVDVHYGQQEFNEIIRIKSEKYGIQAKDFIQSYWSQSNSLVYSLKCPTNMLQKNFVNVFDPKWLQSFLEPSDKLACVGGLLGIISLMKQNQIEPNIVTLTSIIGCLPYEKGIKATNSESDEFFVAVIKQLAKHFKLSQENVFNNALYKRNIQSQGASVSEILDSSRFDPYTWSIYGRKCKVGKDVNSFFKLMQENQVNPNSEIFYTLMRSVSTWGARVNIIQKMKQYQVPFNRSIIAQIEDEISKNREKIKSLTKEELNSLNLKAFYKFQKMYTKMLDETQTESVDTGDKKIFIDDLPNFYKTREN